MTPTPGRPQTPRLSPAYRRLVELAEANLGPSLNDYRGGWWSLLETRPYLRARAQLAHALERDGVWREAREEYGALLALKPNDDQGIRFRRPPLLLMDGAREEYESLVAAYDGDVGAG